MGTGPLPLRLYGTAWRRFRKRFLQEHPLCVMCEQQGLLTGATVVDHIIPHRGDLELFWRDGNHQALCKTHHDSAKQRAEKSGGVVGCTLEGVPIDPRHPWNR